MALYGGIHSLVAAASLFAHSLAAVQKQARSCPVGCGMFLPSHRRIIPTLYLGVMGQPGSIRVPADRRHYSLCTRFANSFRLWLQFLSEPAALPIRAVWHSLSIIVPFRVSIPRLAKTCRFLQASMN